jgi:hypothetical protein
VYQVSQHRFSFLATTGTRSELELVLCRLLAERATTSTLELVGLANPDKLLVLGDWVVDGDSRKARALFRELAEQRVLARLGIERVHLRACSTSATDRGRRTLAALAEILGVPVTGEPGLVCLRRDVQPIATRALDLDALPACPVAAGVPILSIDDTRALLALVRRTEGCVLPGLLARSHRELALAGPAGTTHLFEVLLDHEIVRVAGDLVFPVADPRALRALIERG